MTSNAKFGLALAFAAFLVGVSVFVDSTKKEHSETLKTNRVGWDIMNDPSWHTRELYRTKVPNGWLVVNDGNHMVYVPDVEHSWTLKEE